MKNKIKFKNGGIIKFPGMPEYTKDIGEYFEALENGINWELIYFAAPYSAKDPASQAARARLIRRGKINQLPINTIF